MKRIRKKSNYFMVLFLSVIMCFSLIQPIELKASEHDTEIIQEEWIEILEEEEETLEETTWEEENDISLEIENTDLEEEEVDSLEEIIDLESQESQIETQENVIEDASFSVEACQERIDTLPSIDQIKEMSDEEKDALMEELSDILDQLDALLENGIIDTEQYEAMVLKIMVLNDEMIGDTPALMEGTVTTIKSINDLSQFRDEVNSGTSYEGQTVTLTSDLDLSSVGNWTPIGNKDNPFMGTFNGGYRIIKNLSIDTASRYCGLFGRIENATIKNLGLENVNVQSGDTDVAGLAGNAIGGSIERCYVTGSVSGYGGVSGILGSTHSSSYPTTIQNCYARVELTHSGSTADIAGISGWNEATSVKIENCYSACIGEVRPIAGWSDGNAVYNNRFVSTYFDKTLSPNFSQESGRTDLGRTSNELKDQSTFEGWDFDSIWAIDSSKNGGYPYLRDFNNPGLGGAPGSVTVTVTDNNNTPVTYATVVLKNGATEITLGHQGNGVYSGTVTTSGETYDIYVNGQYIGKVTPSGNSATTQYVIVDFHIHRFCGTNCSHSPTHDYKRFTAWDTNNSLPTTEGYYYLTTDVTLTATWTIPAGETSICLNGHSITMTGNGSVILVNNSSSTLNLLDCRNNGIITRGEDSNGRGIYIGEGTVNMYGGSISGNTVLSSQDNYGAGAGIYVNTGTVNMYGGSISGNTTESYGGGILVNENGTVNMCGGSISGNTAFNQAGGIDVIGNFKLSGNAQITGNTAGGIPSDVYLSYDDHFNKNAVITISGALTKNNPIVVTMANSEGGCFTSGWGGYMPNADPADYFRSDSSNYMVTSDNGEVELHKHSWKYSANGAVITETCNNCSHQETATIFISNSESKYTGTEIKPAEVEYSEGWQGGNLEIIYSNNINAGNNASASITKDGVTASFTFSISKADSSVSSPPTIISSTLTYDGSNQALVNGGTASGGTMQYRLGESGSYSDNIPTATDAGEYNVYYYVKGNSNYKDCGSETSPLGSISVTINKRDITVTPDGGQYKIYGDADSAFTYQITSGSLANATDLQNGALSRVSGDTKGTYAFAIGTLATCNSNYNVTLATGESVPTFEIRPRPVELEWYNNNLVYTDNLVYTGNEQEITAQVSNAVSNDNIVLSYKENKKTNVGTYAATVTEIENENYTLAGGTNITKTWGISYLQTNASVTTDGTTNNGWFTSNVTLTPDRDYQISRDDVNWSDTLTVTEDGENILTYYLKNASGQIAQKSITVKKDSTKPSGEIRVGEHSVHQSSNPVIFKYFFKNRITVEISGTDTASGVAKIEYQKVENSASFNKNGTWTEVDSSTKSFTMNANDKGIIYVRITDHAGNYTIINSDGIVVYTDSTESDAVSYIRTTQRDVITNIEVNGNTVKEVKNGNTILDNSNYSVDTASGKIVLKGEYLDTLSAGGYTLTVSYNPYGVEYTDGAQGAAAAESTIYLTVNRAGAESAGTTITNGDKLSKTYDGNGPVSVISTSKNSSTPRVEYKKKDAPDTTYSENAPIDAGDYVVRVTYPQNEYYEASSAKCEFTIGKKEVELNWRDTALTYNGQAQKPTATVTNKVGNDTVNVTVTGEEVDRGTHTATADSLDNTNYKLPATRPTQIYTIVPKDITVKITPNGGTYGGTITSATAEPEGYVEEYKPEVTLTYTGTANDNTSYNSTTSPSKAGTYTVTATVADTNYNLTGTATAQFVVAKASPDLTVNTTSYNKTYGDADFSLDATKAEGAGALSYSVTFGDAVSVNENGTVTIQKAGTAIITVSVEANANYNGDRQDVTVEVERLIPSTPPEPEKEEFIKDTELSPKAPIDGVSFNNEKEELLKAPAIFTESEKKEIEDGRGARVWIEVTEAEEEKITAEDKGKIETAVKESAGEASQLVYFNVDLFKQVSGGEKTQIFEPGVMIQVTIKIPEELINKDESVRREYQIIRLHVDSNTGESTADVLESTFDAETKELTYQSDKFSVYVIAYKDIPVTPAEPEKPEKPTAPGTDDQQFQNSLGMNGRLKVSQTGNQINIEWGKVDGADGYNVYAAYCGEKFTKKYVRRVSNSNLTKITLKKINGKKLNLKKNYKLYVEAYKIEGGKERILGRTITAHIVGRENSKCSNAKNIKLEKSSFALKIGETATIKAETILVDKSKKQLSDTHTKEFRYESSNKKVAKVDKNGKIKAVGKGSCYIYVYARNGYTKKVKVTVK